MSRTRPGLALALLIFMFSLAGIPPLLGFFAKLQVFLAAVHSGLFAFAAVGAAASTIGAFYYLKIVKTMYFDEPAPAFAGKTDLVEGGLIVAAALVISPVGWLLLRPLELWTTHAAQALF
jgi:NADH-quinone oxidoreductase subunit N